MQAPEVGAARAAGENRPNCRDGRLFEGIALVARPGKPAIDELRAAGAI
jgi:hypothetical protein